MPAGSASRDALEALDLGGLHHLFGEPVGEDQLVAGLGPVALRCGRHLVEAVGDLRGEADARLPGMVQGVVVQITTAASSRFAGAFAHRELHPDRVGLVVLVLDLGFGQRGLLDHRPHHRLGAAIELAGLGELQQLAGDQRLGAEVHREVGIVPVAGDAQALELLALHVDPVRGEVAAFVAELVDRDLVLVLALRAVLLLDLPLDRQAVAVPARHVVGVEALHLARAGDDVLQDLVERVADVDVAVGIGRAVMQHEFRAAGGCSRSVL